MKNLHRRRELQAALELRLAESKNCQAEVGIKRDIHPDLEHRSSIYLDTWGRALQYIDQYGIDIRTANDMYSFLEFIMPGANRKEMHALRSINDTEADTPGTEEKRPTINANYYVSGDVIADGGVKVERN